MFASPFFRRLFLPYLLLICLAVGVIGYVGARQLRSSYLERTGHSLENETMLLAPIVAVNLAPDRVRELNAQVSEFGQMLARRITVVAADGQVLADNQADPARMENHRLRPEIVIAASRGEGESIRLSSTVHEGMMYFARRVRGDDGQVFYVRVSVHLQEVGRHLRAFYAVIALAAVLAMTGAAVFCYGFARRTARPLVELTEFAEGLRQGDLSRRILRKETGEIGTLATALNSMADSLGDIIASTRQDKAQLLAVLSSMSEGVIATDTQQHVLLSNAAAARLLGLADVHWTGKLVWEMVRSPQILQAASDVLSGGQRRGIRVGPVDGRHLEVAVCTLPGSSAPKGLVIVMHDATESVRFEDLRKEFVANVSHELRTPLTAIKGFAETLRMGALNDSERGPQFLATIEKHADQLTNLVIDLLELSRLESLPGLPRIASVDIGQIARKAAELLRPTIERKRQTLSVQIASQLPSVHGNPDYLERAIANLLDNAVKYTPEGGQITLSARADESSVVVDVTDNGIGIPPADLPRIFERFYRVDRSRSRDMGGTGLGLSIVKHIAQSHRGSVEATSSPGKGSSFSLRLPVAATLL